MDRAEADSRLSQLKRAGEVPADSFVVEYEDGMNLRRISASGEGAATAAPDAVADDAVAAAEPVVAPVPPGQFIRLQTLRDETEAKAALTTWRETFEGAGLWRDADGLFAVTLGPVSDEAAAAWVPVLKRADVLPGDAFVSGAEGLGQQIEEGAAPDLAAPPATPLPMPPLEEVQSALRWAGLYPGDIDGKDGPRTQAGIAAQIATGRASTDPGTAIADLIASRAKWREDFGLTTLHDQPTSLSVTAPMHLLEFDRTERALSIYGPKDGSGVAMILFSQQGGQQELLDLSGLVTALGWVPKPERSIQNGHVVLQGRNDAHIGRAEGWVRDGFAEGYVLIWPAADAEDQARMAAEMSDSLKRDQQPANAEAGQPSPAQDSGIPGLTQP
ncbi:peptidoglycan-binding protein [Paracoccus caeni]|uniref:Peptidoglycan-binding protein n=1 Tax=Paracoccus caeni TaxID=657651 RepID=A0A934SGQ6_9RHOB|nr:peptidoglycan-binding protein [Paracoccus caeni]